MPGAPLRVVRHRRPRKPTGPSAGWPPRPGGAADPAMEGPDRGRSFRGGAAAGPQPPDRGRPPWPIVTKGPSGPDVPDGRHPRGRCGESGPIRPRSAGSSRPGGPRRQFATGGFLDQSGGSGTHHRPLHRRAGPPPAPYRHPRAVAGPGHRARRHPGEGPRRAAPAAPSRCARGRPAARAARSGDGGRPRVRERRRAQSHERRRVVGTPADRAPRSAPRDDPGPSSAPAPRRMRALRPRPHGRGGRASWTGSRSRPPPGRSWTSRPCWRRATWSGCWPGPKRRGWPSLRGASPLEGAATSAGSGPPGIPARGRRGSGVHPLRGGDALPLRRAEGPSPVPEVACVSRATRSTSSGGGGGWSWKWTASHSIPPAAPSRRTAAGMPNWRPRACGWFASPGGSSPMNRKPSWCA